MGLMLRPTLSPPKRPTHTLQSTPAVTPPNSRVLPSRSQTSSMSLPMTQMHSKLSSTRAQSLLPSKPTSSSSRPTSPESSLAQSAETNSTTVSSPPDTESRTALHTTMSRTLGVHPGETMDTLRSVSKTVSVSAVSRADLPLSQPPTEHEPICLSVATKRHQIQ